MVYLVVALFAASEELHQPTDLFHRSASGEALPILPARAVLIEALADLLGDFESLALFAVRSVATELGPGLSRSHLLPLALVVGAGFVGETPTPSHRLLAVQPQRFADQVEDHQSLEQDLQYWPVQNLLSKVQD